MSDKKYFLVLFIVVVISSNVAINNVTALQEGAPSGWDQWGLGPLVKRGERKSIVSTENGQISSVRVADGITGSYHLQFITLEPNSLLLPVFLHSDMIFFVHTGSGRLTWMDEDEQKSVDLRIGDVFRVPDGSIFFLESSLEPERQKLRLYSIFANAGDALLEPLIGPYSSIRNMVLGFDRKVLQAAFNVPEQVIDEVLNGTEVPAIIHGVPKTGKKNIWEMESQFMRALLGRGSYGFFDTRTNKHKKKSKSTEVFNVFDEKPDFENCNGWSTVITKKKLPALKGSHIGIYVVNLTKGSMMGPHWNPMATEIGIALQGEGMVRVVCPSITGTEQNCKNMRLKVEEGDVFAVPRFRPMAQMAFNNNSFVFVGFSTTTKKHHPQYLAGKASVLRTLDRRIWEASFNVANTTMDQILEAQEESVILDCTSCAEEELRLMEEERKREEEEIRRKEEEEARKREEEERREEEEARRKEEEAARKQEEEIRRRQQEEEARKRWEEEQRQKQEEEARKKWEEEQRQKQEEEARKRWEEEQRRKQEEEAKRKQQEEEARRRQQEEEEEARQQEEEIRRRQQEEEARKRWEEEQRQKQEEEEAKRRQQKEKARQEEEEQARKQEEEIRRRQEEEEARRREEEEKQRQAEEARRRQQEEEEARRREQEEEEARRQHEEAARREEEEARSEEEQAREAERRREEEAEREQEAARRQEEEMQRHEQGEATEEQGQQTRTILFKTI